MVACGVDKAGIGVADCTGRRIVAEGGASARISGATNAPSIMIGGRAAEFIRAGIK